mgnify:CR=1 FL=1
MNKYPIWKSFTVISLVLIGIIFSIPSIIYNDDSDNWFLKNKINLGLDLQGGSYLLLEVQLDVLYQEELENFSDSIRLIARDNSAKINQIIVNENDIIVSFADKNKINEIKNSFFQMYRSVSTQLEDNKLIIKIDDMYKKTIQDSAIKQSLEIVRKRIDESGTKEPLIQRSGKKRILLQLPGVKDPERIKELLGKTAKLTFHLVDDENISALKANIEPFGKMIVSDIYDKNTKYLLEYKFDPGHPDDGISIKIPLSILHQTPRYLFEWLVPGMLEEKCIEMVKALPKRVRKQFVPIPESVNSVIGYSGKIIDTKHIENNIKSRPDIILMHGDKDEVVPVSFLLEAKELFNRINYKIQTKIFQNCEHRIPQEGSSLGLEFIKKKLY